MAGYSFLDFRDARCKDCYKCLRECPVKAIKVVDRHAKIIDDRCILCGHCTKVCPQNAKSVHSERADVEKLLRGGNVIASVAPSFVSSFNLQDFSVMRAALRSLGFADAEETSVGAREVTAQYKKLLEGGAFKNFITSCCPAVNRRRRRDQPRQVLPAGTALPCARGYAHGRAREDDPRAQ